MALNTRDASALLNKVYNHACKATNVAVSQTDYRNFASVANALATIKRDDVLNSITQVITKTLFRTPTYKNRLEFMVRDSSFYSMWIRKLTPFLTTSSTDPAFAPPATVDSAGAVIEGTSIDPFKVKKVKWLETHFQNVSRWYDYNTVFDKQFDGAFESESAFSAFLSNALTTVYNSHVGWMESACRTALLTAICLKDSYSDEARIHLITEYNAEHGTEFTKQQIMLDENYLSFSKWAGARIAKARNLLLAANTYTVTPTNGSELLGNDINFVARSCNESDLRTVVLSKYAYLLDNVVKSSTYNPSFLNAGSNVLTLDFWQSASDEESIKCVVGKYNQATLTYNENLEWANNISNLIGVIFDINGAGVAFDETIVEQIRNPAGLYTDFHYHDGCKAMIDPTEKMLLLYLD